MKNQSLMSLGVAIVSYLAMSLFITLWQAGIFHQVISFNKSTPFVLIVGGIGTFACAVLAGWIATKLNKFNTYLPQIIMSFLVCLESSYLIAKDKTGDPLWFDILAGLSLIVGIFIGYNISKRIALKTQV